jgi:hypothetical protein
MGELMDRHATASVTKYTQTHGGEFRRSSGGVRDTAQAKPRVRSPHRYLKLVLQETTIGPLIRQHYHPLLLSTLTFVILSFFLLFFSITIYRDSPITSQFRSIFDRSCHEEVWLWKERR